MRHVRHLLLLCGFLHPYDINPFDTVDLVFGHGEFAVSGRGRSSDTASLDVAGKGAIGQNQNPAESLVSGAVGLQDPGRAGIPMLFRCGIPAQLRCVALEREIRQLCRTIIPPNSRCLRMGSLQQADRGGVLRQAKCRNLRRLPCRNQECLCGQYQHCHAEKPEGGASPGRADSGCAALRLPRICPRAF